MSKIQRDIGEIKKELNDQLYMLHRCCERFDDGEALEYKTISTIIRILVHNTKKSTSLFSLSSLSPKMFDSSYVVPDTFIIDGAPSKATRRSIFSISMDSRFYAPLFNTNIDKNKLLDIDNWWNGVVFTDSSGVNFTRKDIILSVANQDGGAHVDPAINESYYALTRKNTHGFRLFVTGTVDGKVVLHSPRFFPSPHFIIVRQIAHELLVSVCSPYGYVAREKYPALQIHYMQAEVSTGGQKNANSTFEGTSLDGPPLN